MTSATPKPRAGEQADERIAELEEVKRAYARDIHLLWAECDALRSRNTELVEALRGMVSWYSLSRQQGDMPPAVDRARSILAKAPA